MINEEAEMTPNICMDNQLGKNRQCSKSLTFEEFCIERNLSWTQLSGYPGNERSAFNELEEEEEEGTTALSEQQPLSNQLANKPQRKNCIVLEAYNAFQDFQRENPCIPLNEFHASIERHAYNVIEGVLAVYKSRGLDLLALINQYVYAIREVDFNFLIYLSLFFAGESVVDLSTLKREVRAQRVRYLHNFKSKSTVGRIDLCFVAPKYGAFKVEMKSLSPSDYRMSKDGSTISINPTLHIRLSLKCSSKKCRVLDDLVRDALYQARSYIQNATAMVLVLLRSPCASRIVYSHNRNDLPNLEDLTVPLHNLPSPGLEEEILTSALVQTRIDHLQTLLPPKPSVAEEAVVVPSSPLQNEDTPLISIEANPTIAQLSHIQQIVYSVPVEIQYLMNILSSMEAKESKKKNEQRLAQKQRRQQRRMHRNVPTAVEEVESKQTTTQTSWYHLRRKKSAPHQPKSSQ